MAHRTASVSCSPTRRHSQLVIRVICTETVNGRSYAHRHLSLTEVRPEYKVIPRNIQQNHLSFSRILSFKIVSGQ